MGGSANDKLRFLDEILTDCLVCIRFNRMVISMVYYGFLLYISRLSGNPYLNLFFMYLTDVPTHLICWVLLQK